MRESIYLTILLTLLQDDGQTLTIGEDDGGKLYWTRTAEPIYLPGDALSADDVYPISTLPEATQTVIQDALAALQPELLEELRTGWDTEEG